MNWEDIIEVEKQKPYYNELMATVKQAYESTIVYPPKERLFEALNLTPLDKVKVVIIGQDPYHGPNQAHGLSFSIASDEAKFPPSLRNIFKELATDIGIERTNQNLSDWATQGVLMLNRVFTVEATKAGSHQKWGWEHFSDALIEALNAQERPIVYILWGASAGQLEQKITNPQHLIIKGVHPSPLSAHRGFFGSKPFSQVNEFLTHTNQIAIKW